MFFDSYYMKNEEYALEKYNGFKIGVSTTSPYTKETIIDKNTKVYYWIDERNDSPSYYVLDGAIVYDMWSDSNSHSKNQALFDALNIKYSVPNYTDVIKK